jgi:hypothetical protein
MTIHKTKGQPVEVVQLEVDELLGDFGGYSGSAVLDSLGRAVLALLVEQKPLRTATDLGERSTASNVLYAVPIGDVITANDLSVRITRPLRFDVGLPLPGMVTRPGLLDKAVSRVIASEAGETGAGLVLLRGPGGVGKTVLARQVADDVQVWAKFTDGIVMLRAGEKATADSVARQLQEALGRRGRLAEVLVGQRLLLIVDDVWDRDLLATLQAYLPPTVVVLATTRGVSVPGAAAVPVGTVSQEEAIQILARGTARSDQLDQSLGALAQALFHWALLLTLAAAEIHRDDDLDLGFDDDDNRQAGTAEPTVLIERAGDLQAEFPNDPTMLDDLAQTPEGAPPRSVAVLVRRSLDWLGTKHRALFELLAVYPPDAAITQPMLEDLWQTPPQTTIKEIKHLVRAGLAQPVQKERLTIELHDLITAWLHHENGVPGDARHQPVHQRLARLSALPDGSPGRLTQDRAEWLAHYLVSAGAWDGLKALATLRWRSAFLVATGSDAAFLAALDHYGHAARAQAPDAIYHAVRAWLCAAHVRALIGALPIRMLVGMALVGDNPIASITQAGQHPSAGEAIPAVLAAVGNRIDTYLMIDRALAVVDTIPAAEERGRALAGITERLAGTAPADPALIDRALAVAKTITDDGERGRALAGIATWLASAAPADPALIDRALAVAETIRNDTERGRALAGIAGQLADTDPARTAALIDGALAVAKTITEDRERGLALYGITERLAGAAPADLALIDQALAVAKTITGGWPRGEALAGIATWLARTAPADPALIDRALTVTETIPNALGRGLALAAIAEQLADTDPAQAEALTGRAMAAVEATPERDLALAGIAERLAAAAPADPAVIDLALTVAETIPNGGRRGEALAGIAGQLADTDPAQAEALIDRALAAAKAIPNGGRRGEALAGIAERLADAARADPALIDRALATAKAITDSERRGGVLASIAGQLAGTDPAQAEALISRALALAETIPGDGWRSEALASIAGQLAEPAQATALIDRALVVAKTIRNHWERARALAGIAERLARSARADPALIDRALALANAIPSDGPRGEALAGIATWLPRTAPAGPALIDRALAVAKTIPNTLERGLALAGIAGQLADTDPAQTAALTGRAVALAETIPDDSKRGEALAGIAERLTGAATHDPALIHRALAVAETIPDDKRRSEALASIAGQLADTDPAQTAALIDRALAAAETIPDDWERSPALASIAAWLAGAARADPPLIDRALAVAETIPDDKRRSEALASIAGQLADTDPAQTAALIDRALEVANAIPDDWWRGEALAGIVERLAGAATADPALIDRALAVAETIPGDGRRGQAVSRIHALTRNGTLDELSRWRLRSLGASVKLLDVFLNNCHDKATAERIGLAVLDVVEEFPSGS